MNNDRKKTNAKFTEVGFGAAYFSVAIISVLLVAAMFSFIVATFTGGGTGENSPAGKDWYMLLSACVTPFALAVSGLVFCKAFGENVKEACRIKKAEPKYYLYAVLLVAACFFGLSSLNGLFIDFLTEHFGYKPAQSALPSFSALNFILTIITVCILPAIFEEFLFRGILTRSLSGSGRLTAALIAGVYFSIFHMNPAQTPYQFVTGFCFCLLALESGSVFPSVVAHFLNNFVIVLLYYLVPSFESFTGIWLVVSVIGGLICLAAFLFLTLKGKIKDGKLEYGYDYKTFFLYSAIGVAACLLMWLSGLFV